MTKELDGARDRLIKDLAPICVAFLDAIIFEAKLHVRDDSRSGPRIAKEGQSTRFRVGSRVKLNVYDGDRPLCQCHSESDSQMVVDALTRLHSTAAKVTAVPPTDAEIDGMVREIAFHHAYGGGDALRKLECYARIGAASAKAASTPLPRS